MDKRRLSISTFGAILGIAGIEHGVGEILQGREKPRGPFIQSWPGSSLYEILAGEPAFTVLTNSPVFVTGILAMFASLLLIIGALFLIEKKYGGYIIFGFTIFMFLFGAGIAGPLLIGIILSLASTKLHSTSSFWKKHPTWRIRFLPVWKYTYPVSVVSWFLMWPGLVIMGFFLHLTPDHGNIVVVLSVVSFLTFVLTLISAFAYETSMIKIIINQTR